MLRVGKKRATFVSTCVCFRYTCKQCHTTFSLRCNLRRHERLHEGHKPFQCQWCPKTFSRNGDLKIHEWKHKEATGSAVSQENGVEEGIIVIEPTDVDDDEEFASCSNDSADVATRKGVGVSGGALDMSKKFGGASAFAAVKAGGSKSIDVSSVVSLLAQNVMKSVSKDPSCGGSVESVFDSQLSSESAFSQLYTKYIDSNSPASAIADLAQAQQESLAAGLIPGLGGIATPGPPALSLLSQSTKLSKKSKSVSYPAVNEALKDWSSAPNSPASHARNLNSPSPGPPKSNDSSPKGSPKAEPVPRRQNFCLLCKEWWDDFAAYESHCAGVHGRYPCQYCGQTFSNKNNRARHGRSHTGQKQFTCGHCGKSFTRSDILREHQIIHTESYHGDQCQYCGTKITTKKADLLAHIKKCIQLNKYSPSLIQAKIEAAANGEQSTLPLEYTPTKFLAPPAKPDPAEFTAVAGGEAVPDTAEAQDVSPNEELFVPDGISTNTSPRSLLSNNNKGEKTPPKLPNSAVADGGIMETVPIQGAD